MKRNAPFAILAAFTLSACAIPPGQIKKQTAPGQVMQKTGVHPVSGARPAGKRG
ncbi:MAG: hypothetical protein ACOY5C_01715 [Pseudomonadota bacterium]|uniref:hypothetical protein n=1 Tax=Thermithiobacillus tepidarius TaxID=929 RepID=UPI00040A18FD|nr:hypothetical protein [Thermithiobacillus tepidarius]